MNRRRNGLILGLVLALLVLALLVVIPGSPLSKDTKLGLDLKGGVELVYEGRPTPQTPEVTPQNIDDAIETIRKRTDALGVSEPEIQRAGANQISIGLPAVDNAERAEQQVGTTAQLQFYDWESNGFPVGTAPTFQSGLFPAVEFASEQKPRAEKDDIPPGGPSEAVEKRYNGDQQKINEFYDRENDSARDKYYLFGPGEGAKRPLIPPGSVRAGTPDTAATANEASDFYANCKEILEDYESELPETGSPGPTTVPKDSECKAELETLGDAGPKAGSEVVKVPRGVVVVRGTDEEQKSAQQSSKDAPTIYYVLEDDSELTGSDIKDPKQQFDQDTNLPNVTFEFTDKGQKAFESVTKRIAQRGLLSGSENNFAITLDNQIVSLASIDPRRYPEGIDGSNGAQISGVGNVQEAQDLAESLRIGALPIELKLISKTQVSATLGQQALDEGLVAGAVGFALVLLFLLFFYRVLGAIAGIALIVYGVFLFALVKIIGITLTLPGIAGLILTLGVAADANIVIFERIKEEARAGASIPRAISQGYAKALRTIVDANVVTIGVAFILFMLATAGIKGFAFTLGVGTLLSLFTAVIATSAMLGALSRTKLLRSKWALNPGSSERSWRFDYSGNSRWFFSGSGVILVICAFAIAISGINFGIDFESGTRVTTPLERAATVDQVRDALGPIGLGDAKIQKVDDPALGNNVVQVSTSTLQPDEVNRLQQQLDKEFGVTASDFSSDSIGPTFGEQIARTALIAIVASLILISIYIGLRFEFKYAVPVLIALAHDLLITAGVYALFQREVSTSTVAALLTILGFSLYDTIIVFDRVRENVPRMPRATFSQIVNRSMSEVIVRSLVTSFSTLMPVLALMLFGGETLQDFGFALLVGIASGAYSSIFIAAPVLTHWKEREPVYQRRIIAVKQAHGGVIPAYTDGAIATDLEVSDAASGAPARKQRVAPKPGRAQSKPSSSSSSSTGGGGSAAQQARRERARQRAAAAEADAAEQVEADEPESASPDTPAAPAAGGDGGSASQRAPSGDGDNRTDEDHDKPINRRRKKHGRR